jgi:hypothetical protein
MRLAEPSASRPKEPKVKATYSLSSRLKRLVDTTADDLDIDSSELVSRLLSAALRGVSRPGIPAELRRQLGAEPDPAIQESRAIGTTPTLPVPEEMTPSGEETGASAPGQGRGGAGDN